MDTSKHTDPNSLFKYGSIRASKGFTLIEIALTTGIVSFALVAIMGLLSTGLVAFRGAIDRSVGAQIAQKVVNDSEQTDFTTFAAGGGSQVFCKSVRYFDGQGNELPSLAGATYYVNTRVSIAATMPATGGVSTANPNLAMVTIQVADNPGGGQLALGAPNSLCQGLWTGAFQSQPLALGVVPIATYCTYISRNK